MKTSDPTTIDHVTAKADMVRPHGRLRDDNGPCSGIRSFITKKGGMLPRGWLPPAKIGQGEGGRTPAAKTRAKSRKRGRVRRDRKHRPMPKVEAARREVEAEQIHLAKDGSDVMSPFRLF